MSETKYGKYILTELIKHSEDSPEQLVRRVRSNGILIGVDEVRNLLVYHDLLKKNWISSSSSFKETYCRIRIKC